MFSMTPRNLFLEMYPKEIMVMEISTHNVAVLQQWKIEWK